MFPFMIARPQGYRTRATRILMVVSIIVSIIVNIVLPPLVQQLPPALVNLLPEVPTASAHYLNTTQAWALMDQATLNMIAARAATNNQPLIRSGDEITLIMKSFPSDGTTFGAGGYMSFYIPAGTQVTDVAYVYPDGSGGYAKIPVKNPSPTDDNAGDRGPDNIPELIGLTYGPNAIGRVERAVEADGTTRGTLAGVMGDTGIFYSTDPRTSWNSWYNNIGTAHTYCTNPNGDCRVSSQTNGLTRPSTAWDAMQALAYGSDSVGTDVSLPFATAGPLIDPSGHGSTAWGLANAVAGPESGYAWGFDMDIWSGSGSAANVQASVSNVGPWKRIQYPGSTISDDRQDPGNALAVSVQDASQLGRNIVSDPLGPTLSHTDSSSPKAIRVSVGGIEQGRPEYISVKLRILENPGSANPNPYDANGCFEAHAEAFAGDAGYTDNNKDHIYRYVKFSTVTFNPCTMLTKRASVASVKAGDTFEYYVQFVNSGGVTIPAFTITDPVPNGLTINSVTAQYIDASASSSIPVANTGSGNTIVWNLSTSAPGGVAPGDVFRATIRVTATGNGPFVNAVTTNGTILPATERVEGADSAIIIPRKVVNQGTVAPGATVRYTLAIDNVGSAPTETGQPIVVEDFLPGGFTYTGNVTATLNGGSVTPTVGGTGSNPSFTVTGQINANNSLLIAFNAQVTTTTPVGTYTNNMMVTYTDPAKGANLVTGYGQAPVFVAGASIGDTVYRDWNNNGQQDPDEEGIAGVVLELNNGSCTPGNNCPTTTTNASGNYIFSGLVAGSYTVRVLSGVPSGYTLTGDPQGALDGVATVTLVTNQALSTVDFGYRPGGTGTIGDLIWHDDDRSGSQNGGEPGIANVTVTLYEDTNNDGIITTGVDALVAQTQSGAGGAYTFPNLATDIHYLVDVNAFDPDITAFFGTGAFDIFTPDPHDVPNTLALLGGTYSTADFGFDTLTPATIGDQVFIDEDGDGIYTTGTDTPLSNVQVDLYADLNGNGVLDAGEPVVRTSSTLASGIYLFNDLPPGDYIVDVLGNDPQVPAGFFPSRDLIAVTGLSEGATVLTADFPFVPLIAKTVSATTAQANDRLTYTVTVNYAGDGLLTNAQVQDTIPTGATYVSASARPAAIASGPNPLVWSLGSNDAGVNGFKSPIAMCPVQLTLTADADTHLRQRAADAAKNYGASNETFTSSKAAENKVALFHFNIGPSTLPAGSVLQSAQFKLTNNDNNASRTVRVHRMTTPWTEGTDNNATCTNGANWSTRNCVNAWAGGSFSASDYNSTVLATINPDPQQQWSVNVQSAVQSWLTGNPNAGLALIPVGSDDGDVSWVTKEDVGNEVNFPQLVISYLAPQVGACSGQTDIVAQDTYIDQNNPTKNYGVDDVILLKNEAGKDIYGLFQFDMSQLPSNVDTISLATFEVTVRTGKADATSSVYPLLRSWTEGAGNNATCTDVGIGGATWNAPKCTDTWLGGAAFSTANYNGSSSLGSFDPTTTNQQVGFTVTSLAQSWFANPATNFGLVAVAEGISTNTPELYSAENTAGAAPPTLEVIWIINPAPGSTTKLAAGPTLVSNGATIDVDFTLSAFGPVTNIVPQNPITVTTTSGNATAVCSSPTLTSGAANINSGSPATYTYQCTVNGATQLSELTFAASATGTADGTAGLPYVFKVATSNSVIVVPPLTFQVDVNDPVALSHINNQATLSDAGLILPTVSNLVTTTLLGFANPAIGLAKSATNVVANLNGTYSVTFTLTAENFGNVALNNVVITDVISNLSGPFASMNPTGLSAIDGSFTANSSWDGTAGSNILASGQSLAVGESKTVQIRFTVTPVTSTTVNNTAYATGVSPSNITVSDQSTDGLDPDRDGDNGDGSTDDDDNPSEDDPTPVSVTLTPRYVVSKSLNTTSVIRPGDDISFTIRITNTGSSAITTLPLRDLYDTGSLLFLTANVAPDDAVNDGQLDWSDLTLSFGPNLAPNQSFVVNTVFVARRDTTALPGGVTINTAFSPISSTQTVTAPVRIEVPTAVALTNRSATYANGQVTLVWTTLNESNVTGFRLLRRDLTGGGAWVQVHDGLINAQLPGQATGASYSFSDEGVVAGRTYLYLVEILDASGQSSRQELGLVEGGYLSFLPQIQR